MDNNHSTFDHQTLEALNEKTIRNEFFTPDHVYIELSLMKDIPIGVIYADKISVLDSETEFKEAQNFILAQLPEYQKRRFDTIDPFFAKLGYKDTKIEQILNNQSELHDMIFLSAPATMFLDTLIRHTIRNQNNSRPANKYIKKSIDKEHYVMNPVDVTYYINTFPLFLSPKLLGTLAKELGESLGVNIRFLNKDPHTFDQGDWDDWLSKIECFYFDNLGRFTGGDFVLSKQEQLCFMGVYFFARKRFERQYMTATHGIDFDQEIQILTAQMDIFCHFNWMQNNDVRLTLDREDVPVELPTPDDKDDPQP